jgi:hypothetical protein
LEDHPQVDFAVFLDKIWENIKEIYQKPGTEKDAEQVSLGNWNYFFCVLNDTFFAF